jgi:hypothetical protein
VTIPLHCPACGKKLKEYGVNFQPGVQIHPSRPAEPVITPASMEHPPTGIHFKCPDENCGFGMYAAGAEAMLGVIASCEFANRMREVHMRIRRDSANSS